MNTTHAPSTTSASVFKLTRPLLSRFKVSQRITVGFAVALGLAFAGTSVGFVVGNFYEDRARAVEELAHEEVALLSQLQVGVLQARTHQQQLIPLLDFPEDLRDEYSHILRHSKTIKTLWKDLAAFTAKMEESGYRYTNESVSAHDFLETYDGVPNAYLRALAELAESIDFESINRPVDIAIARRQLLSFTNSELAITFDGISDDLSSIIALANNELSQSRVAADAAHRLRNQMIVASLLLSSVAAAFLAFLISSSINRPLADLENTAIQISENDSFDLRARATGEDEVGTVAAAFNLLLSRVENLLREQKLREEELEESNRKLISTQTQMIAQEKLASLGSLTAGIAHEIKNPLNFVNNFAELSVELTEELTEEIAAQKSQLDPEALLEITEIVDMLKDNVSKIDQHGKRADKIVANMLQHSRSGNSEWTKADINGMVAEAINLAYHGTRAKHSNFNLDFDADYDKSLKPVRVSAQDLSRVFLNIASNACYAIYQKQLAEGSEYKPLLKVRTRRQAGRIAVHIRDNGPGMSPDVLAKVFDQFFTTKPTGEGTGLGLSLSHNIVVEQHRGSITVESEEGIYTEFIVTLPI